jgi:hypothetical protein
MATSNTQWGHFCNSWRSKIVALNATDVRDYSAKAEEYLEAAEDALAAIHAGINAADAITGALRANRQRAASSAG